MTTTEAAAALREICSDLETMNADPTMIDRLESIADGINTATNYWCAIVPQTGCSVYLRQRRLDNAVAAAMTIIHSDEYIDNNGRDDLLDNDGIAVPPEALVPGPEHEALKYEMINAGWIMYGDCFGVWMSYKAEHEDAIFGGDK